MASLRKWYRIWLVECYWPHFDSERVQGHHIYVSRTLICVDDDAEKIYDEATCSAGIRTRRNVTQAHDVSGSVERYRSLASESSIALLRHKTSIVLGADLSKCRNLVWAINIVECYHYGADESAICTERC